MKSNMTQYLKRIGIILGIAVMGQFGNAQECSSYFPLQKGLRLEYQMLNDKGKSEGSQWQEITSITETPEGTRAEMKMGHKDAKGKEVFSTDYGFLCTRNAVIFDFKSLMSGPMAEQFEDTEVEISGIDLEWPNTLEVGMELPDASIEMKLNMGGMNMSFNTVTKARRVEKKETVTTPAGTFECFVVYSETQAKVMMSTQSVPSRAWMAEGIGLVKSESYDKKGNLINQMVLTSVKR
ncbi:MAG: hypothetical protein RLZZ241_2078 [Bacteroidota bacterium]|jgi:hypothetical protein